MSKLDELNHLNRMRNEAALSCRDMIRDGILMMAQNRWQDAFDKWQSVLQILGKSTPQIVFQELHTCCKQLHLYDIANSVQEVGNSVWNDAFQENVKELPKQSPKHQSRLFEESADDESKLADAVAESNNSMLLSDLQDGVLRLLITLKCNIKCNFCSQRNISEKVKSLEMDPIWLYDYFTPLYEKIKLLMLVGGELTIAKESYAFCQYMSEKYPAVTIMFESNGVAFDDKWQSYASANLVTTHFSVNAVSENTYEHVVGNKGIFYKSVNNIRAYISQLKEKGLLVFAPSISMVVNKDTAHEARDFVKMALEWNTKACVFYFDMNENELKSADGFAFAEIVEPVLKEIMKIERVLAEKIFVFFRLFLPVLKNMADIEREVEAIPLARLKEEYKDLLSLAQNRSMRTEYEERQRIRKSQGKKEFTFDEDYVATLHEIAVGNNRICSSPWNLLGISVDGQIHFCSWHKPRLKLQDFIKDNKVVWAEVINSKEFQMARYKMLNGIYDGCMSSCSLNPTHRPARQGFQ